jgi:hypothetical protein
MPARPATRRIPTQVRGGALTVALAVLAGCARPAPDATAFNAAPAGRRAAAAPVRRSAAARTAEPTPRRARTGSEILRAAPSGTYIDDVLRVQRYEVVRWPEHVRSPLRVWIADGSRVPGWKSTYPGVVRGAFREWSELGLPLKVTFVTDSARAEVRVRWVERFADDVSGRTTWQYNDAGLIRSGVTSLSTFRPDGSRRSDAQLRAIALHEVGHALGLQHALADQTSIMAPRVDVLELSEADKATVRLLYRLPPGRIR